MRGTFALLAALLVATVAEAYELKRDSTGEVVRWPGTAHFIVDDRAPSALEEPLAVEAIAAALREVSDSAPNLDLTFEPGAVTGVGFDPDPDARNQNEIVVLEDWTYAENAIAVTVLTLNAANHEIVDADIALNAEHRLFRVLPEGSRPGGEFDDVQNTLTHELGHAVGLAHNPEREDAVMFPGARRGETSKRTMTDDDLRGLEAIYGPDGEGQVGVGCTATGTRTGAPWWLALALVGLVLRKKGDRRGIRKVACPLFLLFAPLAFAEEPGLQDAEMVATADVVAARTLPPEKGARLLYTELELRVRECISGACEQSVRVKVPGGKFGDYEQVVEHHPVPKAGDVIAVSRHRPQRTPEPKTRLYRLSEKRELLRFARELSGAGLRADLTFAVPRQVTSPSTAPRPPSR